MTNATPNLPPSPGLRRACPPKSDKGGRPDSNGTTAQASRRTALDESVKSRYPRSTLRELGAFASAMGAPLFKRRRAAMTSSRHSPSMYCIA